MLAKMQRWGNSQGLRFPKRLLRQMNILPGDEVDISIKKDVIVVKPANSSRGKYVLKELLSGLPAAGRAKELDWGKAIGKEAW